MEEMIVSALKNAAFLLVCFALAACSASVPSDVSERRVGPGAYRSVQEGHIVIPAVAARYVRAPNRRTTVSYDGGEAPGTIIIDPFAKFLFFVETPDTAIRYPIAVGREGRGFRGQARVGRMAEWPGWTPTANMIRTEPELYAAFADGVPGGRASPLGARALYLYRGSRDTFFRIHGTNNPASIGNSGSAGCIRLFNQDIIDLYERASVGAQVIVRTYDQSLAAEGPEMANRGVELTPKPIDPDRVYAIVEQEERARAEYEATN
ncbi:MAG: L,D-transpeptidase [Dinoroseobacter sp.]|nr:L,D-transpeptidase [Dinoroseobacter sp.]